MLPQNGHQPRPQQHQQPGLPSFMGSNPSFDSSYFNLDPSAAAKQMAALNAASQARIAAGRGQSASLPTGGGTSSAAYLGGITSNTYSPTSHDPSNTANGHGNFQIHMNHGLPPIPNSAVNASYLDSSMSQSNPSRNLQQGNTSLRQRQLQFLHGLANVMSKRGSPLPPSLTGVPAPNYDPNNSQWTIIEPSSEVGSFKLAGKDVDLFKLWGFVYQHGGGPALTSTNGWGTILPHFDLPEEFPQVQANGSTSVALMLSQYYMAILYPFEDAYKRNIQDQQKKAQAQMMGRPNPQPIQPPSAMMSSQGRPPQMPGGAQSGLPGPIQRGSMGNAVGLLNQGMSGTHVSTPNGSPYPQLAHTPQTPHQRPSSSALANQQNSQGVSHGMSSMSMSDTLPNSQQPLGHTSESNLLDQDMQGIKRKLDMEEGESKRTRQKTDPPDGSSMSLGSDRNHADLPLTLPQQPQMSASLPVQSRQRTQPSRRKIEYIPLAREIDTYGGRDLKLIEGELTNVSQRRPLRDINDWGVVDIEALTMSIRSKLSTELSYALTSLTLMSTMHGQTPNSGLPIYDCADLFEEILDLIEDQAFGGSEETSESNSIELHSSNIATHRELLDLIHDEESAPFPALRRRQGCRDINLGPQQRPANIILSVLNIIRNLSLFTNNLEFFSRHTRLVDILLRLCSVTKDGENSPQPTSPNLSMADLITVRRDSLYIMTNIAGMIELPSDNPLSPATLRLARRAIDLIASYLIDPIDAVSPLASIQVVGAPQNGNPKPPLLADVALEVFTRFSLTDGNRQVLSKAVSQGTISCLFESLVHRLPVVEADFHLLLRDSWLSYIEKTILAIYSLAFLAPPEMKQKLKADRKLGLKSVMLRMLQKFLLNPSPETRGWFTISARRAVEAMKVLDDAEDSFDVAESTMPTMSFGMGFGELGDSGMEKGTGLLGGHRDAAWDMLMVREVQADEVLFGELESLARVECH